MGGERRRRMRRGGFGSLARQRGRDSDSVGSTFITLQERSLKMNCVFFFPFLQRSGETDSIVFLKEDIENIDLGKRRNVSCY